MENFFYYVATTFVSHVLQFESVFESSNPTTDSELLRATIFLDNKKITYFRSYDNLLNILGSISGLFELLVVVAGFILIPVTKLSQNTFLVNSIFAFENQNSTLNASMYDMRGS